MNHALKRNVVFPAKNIEIQNLNPNYGLWPNFTWLFLAFFFISSLLFAIRQVLICDSKTDFVL
jgi:hypothetical protein